LVAAAKRAARAKSGLSADASTQLALKKLGLDDSKEALLCLPDSFSDARRPVARLPDEDDSERRLYLLAFTGERRGFSKEKKFLDLSERARWRNVHRLELDLHDEEGDVVTWSIFGNPWPYKDLVEGERLALVGRVLFFGQAKPRAFLQDVEQPPAHAIGKIWVRYLGIPGQVAGDRVEALVRSQLDNPDAFRHCAARLIGAIGMREGDALHAAGCAGFGSFEQVLRGLHSPGEVDHGWSAKTAAHKLSAMAVQAAALRHNLRHPHPDAPIPLNQADLDAIERTLPERLTEDQRMVATSVASRLRDPKPLNALLSGDVGTGKTLAYLLPAVAAHRAGAQVAIIAPTSILADQIARQIVDRFPSMVRGVERIAAGGRIADHQSILVGTPGLTSVATKAKYAPNLLICDEQHKMSTEMREKLVKPWTHVVEVSATPVPRSLASALFGGKEVLNLRECPVRKTFNNVVGDLAMRRRFASMLKWAIDSGQRAAVIYPRVQASGEQDAASVLAGALALEEAFPGKVIAVHGGMKDEDIARAIEAVRSGMKPLIVASTVIETGVDIPSIAAMVVRDADCFGISQLHQLRGRLVRNGGEGWFAMMVQDLEKVADDTLARLRAVEGCTDGYELAEMDLVIRGFGELDGVAQSGSTDTVFRLVRLRPEDFLRHKLSDLAVQGGERPEERENARRRDMQPRLFA
jgi:ATP-dependent DNA helicase RecG